MHWLREGLRRLVGALGRSLFLLSRMRWRHLRAAPLTLTVAISDRMFACWPRARAPRCEPLDWRPGISVVIPERGGIDLLGACLDALSAALAAVAEPVEVIVVVNGSPASDYDPLAARYPQIRWLHYPRALGFTRAVLEGVALARHGGIYLLNNDMSLAPDALTAVLAERNPAVFAIASQILFPDDGRRREETGWTHVAMVGGMPVPRHEIGATEVVRGTVWAGAGSALFHAGLLRKLLPECLPYDPFYWEDVDLGVRAWRMGYESLYCPASRALHLHRVTVNRFYAPAEVERIFERNRLQFQLRNPFPRQALLPQMLHLVTLDAQTLSEVGGWRACRALWRMRWHAFRAPFHDLGYDDLPLRSYRWSPASGTRPTLLLVSPFAILPPRHGGAVRTQRLAVELARDFDLILLSDERALYAEPDDPSYAPFQSVHLVDGRPPLPPAQAGDRIARVRNHAHAALRLELERLLSMRRPCAVLVEHMELAGLIDECAQAGIPSVLSLQDVLLQPADPAQSAADQFERALIERFDAVVVSSPEDQALLNGLPSVLVPNGCDLPAPDAYRPSAGHNILFVGPFRAEINWIGIRDFVATVYPLIEAQVPGVSLTIVGGPGARARAATEPTFTRAGIGVLDTVDSLHELLVAAALTINPQPTLRGSSIKVLESLSAGRACVCTEAGARGHLDAGFPGLVVCHRLTDFGPRLIDLLLDPASRHVLETPDYARLSQRSWERCAWPLRELLAGRIESMQAGSSGP